ncbi:phage tail fiber domain protein [Escherichia coli p0305293.1]|nr:phage tail fiber domain protein [Escherichia coli p0305293.1]EMZ86652.1 phage tail fiber domain protein [Escherichia coli p0305293.1]
MPHRLLQQPQRRLAKPLNRPAQQRGLLPQRRHPRRTRKRRKPAQNPQNGCRIVRQFGGVIGIIGVCFKR